MGWLFYRRDKGETNVEHFQRKLGEHSVILDGSTVAGTFYAAVRRLDTNDVGAMVVLTRWNPRDPDYNFGYKDMDEAMGPYETKCPTRILDLLTSTAQYGESAPTADEWRAACREYAAQRRAVKKGVRIRLPKNSTGYTVFEAADVRRNRFYPVSNTTGETIRWGLPYRISWWRQSFEVVT